MKIIYCLIFFVLSCCLKAQSFIFPADVFFDSENQAAVKSDSGSLQFHSGLLPYNNASKIYGQRNNDLFVKNRKWLGRKLFNEDLIELQHVDYETGYPRKFQLNISPLFNFQGGTDLSNRREKLFVNTRGILIKGNIGEKFSFESAFFENQATLPAYQDSFALATLVIPGSGRWKNFKSNGYDYAMASGYISYKACKNFSLQLGHGKFKIGNGYRSLLLSDNAFTYPYVRLSHNWWKGKIQYTNIYALLMNLNAGGVTAPPGTEKLFQKKAAAFHHLSFNFNKYLNVSFFQSLIWEKPDTRNRQQITAEYFNPLIFTNLAFFGLNTAKNKNTMIGADICVTPFNNFNLYGQVAIDETGGTNSLSNKSGYQAGIKYYNAFALKNLFIQVEYNQVRPYTYSAVDPAISYTHYNQPLAHPLGANFKEAVALFSYRWKRIFVQGKINLIRQGLNKGSVNSGANVLMTNYFVPLTDNVQNQGAQSQTVIVDLKTGYLFNPKTNFTVTAGCLLRKQVVSGGSGIPDTKYFYIGIKTSLYNQYWDF